MRKFYTLLIVAIMLMPFISISKAQDLPDSVKIVMLRVKSTKADNNWSGNSTALCNSENDLIAKASISDFTLTSNQLDSAVLRIYFKTPNVKGKLDFFDMDPNWVDTTVTWNSAASLTVADTSFATLNVNKDEDTHYWLNITDYLKAKLDAEEDFGWRTVSVDGTASATSRTSYHTDPIMQPTIFLYLKDFTGINHQKGTSISVFPNPATDYLRIEVGENINGTVALYNMVGTKVLSQQIQSENITLDLTKIKSGIYFLSIESASVNIQASKIIVH